MTNATPNPTSPSHAHARNASSRPLVSKSPKRHPAQAAEHAFPVMVTHLAEAYTLFAAAAKALCVSDRPIQIP